MQEKGIISTNQYVWLLFSIITSFSTLQVAGMLILHVGRDAWLSVVCAWFLDVMLAIVYAYLGLRFPRQNMIEYSMSILGKFFGRIVGALFALFFLTAACGLIRSLCTLVSKLFYPDMPVDVLLAISFILIAVGTKKGLEAFARTSEILGPIYLLSFIILFSILIKNIRFDNLKPQLYEGVFPFLSGTPFLLSFLSICIIMGMFIPYCNKPQNGFLGKFISVTIGSFMFIMVVVFSICVFSSEESGNMINPGLQLTRFALLGSIVQRLEAIWLMVAVAAGIMSAISLIWAFSLGVSQLAGLKTYKPVVYPATLLAFIVTITSFDNSNDIFNFTNYVFPFLALFCESGLEILLFIMALVLKKRGNS